MQRKDVSEVVRTVAAKAALAGVQLEPFRDGTGVRRELTWNVAGQCTDPWPVGLWHTRRTALRLRSGDVSSERVAGLTVNLLTRCRKCKWCRKMRERFWQGRAWAELEASPRSFFGTLTASLDNQYRLDALARLRASGTGVDFDTQPDREKFEARALELGVHVTTWLKRVRSAGAEIRYLMIAEAHNSAETSVEMRHRPHVHLLVHERKAGTFFDGRLKRVVKQGREHAYLPDEAAVRQAWTLGFSKFEVAHDGRASYYVCKYLTKEALVRVRASQGYGSPPAGYYTERSEEETA